MACVLSASHAAAQTTLSGFDSTSDSRERINENHWKLSGGVELNDQKDTKLYADDVEIFVDQDRAIATGNVLLTQGSNRIAADRADFNTKTRLGTFYHASGIANIQPPRQAPTPGAFAPPLNTTDTDVYFFGDVIEKIGAKKYKITNGGFSTCVQPTPRWDLHADTVVLNIDHYTLLRNAILNVKGVPLLYVPVMYFPTKDEDRATGILIPTYGASSLRGQSISQRLFLGHQSQPGRDLHARLVFEGGPGLRVGISLQLRRRLRWRADRDTCSTRRRPRARMAACRRRGRSSCAAPPIRRCRTICACAAASTTSRIWRSCSRSTPTSTTSRATSARMPAIWSARGERSR